MFGSLLKEKYAKKDAEDGRTTYHISIMPCTAKKMEAARPEFTHDGVREVDLVLTTQELIDMIKESGIQLRKMEYEAPDLPLGLGSGAGVIFGTTGGVAEAVARYVLPDKSKNTLRELNISPLRGEESLREVTLNVNQQEIRIAIVHGLINAKKLLKKIEAGEVSYHLVEVMTCPGGCVGGAGQPHGLKGAKDARREGLYRTDRFAPFKRAEYNPVLKGVRDEYTQEELHHLLHVKYRQE
jgi:NADH-quinone oxidoreductase subunit G